MFVSNRQTEFRGAQCKCSMSVCNGLWISAWQNPRSMQYACYVTILVLGSPILACILFDGACLYEHFILKFSDGTQVQDMLKAQQMFAITVHKCCTQITIQITSVKLNWKPLPCTKVESSQMSFACILHDFTLGSAHCQSDIWKQVAP